MELEAYGHSKISIHALREEGDQRWQCVSVDGLGFLSTPSARRATAINLGSGAMRGDFYPRPPRGGRPGNTQAQTRRSTFLSTPSARRATTSATAISRKQRNFYPRPPRGGRLIRSIFHTRICVFLSPPSARRATGCSQGICFGSRFLSTPSARRATARRRFHCGLGQGFLSTPSARRATQGERVSLANSEISIHALREEGDQLQPFTALVECDFYPRPPRGGRHVEGG